MSSGSAPSSRAAQRLRTWFSSDAPPLVLWSAAAWVAHMAAVGRIALAESLFGIAFLTFGAALIRRRIAVEPDTLYLPLQLFAAGSLLSAAASRNPGGSFGDVGDVIWVTSFPIGVTLATRVPGLLRIARHVLLVLGTYLTVHGIFQFAVLGYGWKLLDQRITGPLPHVMTYSGIILAISLFFLPEALGRPSWKSWLGTAGPAVALALTMTRSAWIGFAAAAGALLLVRRPKLFAWSVPVVLLALTFSPLAFFGRVTSVFDTRQASNLDRVRMAQAGVEMIRDYPLLGVGPGEVRAIYPLYRKDDAPRFAAPHLHSNVIHLWAERGLITVAGYLLFAGWFALRCWRHSRLPGQQIDADRGFTVVVALTVAGVFEFNFGDVEVLFAMLAIMALVTASLKRAPAPETAAPGSSAFL